MLHFYLNAGTGSHNMKYIFCVLQLKYKEVYEKSKAHINIDPEAHEIRAAKEAYKNITNVSVLSGSYLKMALLNPKILITSSLIFFFFLA